MQGDAARGPEGGVKTPGAAGTAADRSRPGRAASLPRGPAPAGPHRRHPRDAGCRGDARRPPSGRDGPRLFSRSAAGAAPSCAAPAPSGHGDPAGQMRPIAAASDSRSPPAPREWRRSGGPAGSAGVPPQDQRPRAG